MAVRQRLVGIQVAVAFRVMGSGHGGFARSRAAGDAADEDLGGGQTGANQRYRGQRGRRGETARVPDMRRINRVDVLR